MTVEPDSEVQADREVISWANDSAMLAGPHDGEQESFALLALAKMVATLDQDHGVERVAVTFASMSSAAKVMMFVLSLRHLAVLELNEDD